MGEPGNRPEVSNPMASSPRSSVRGAHDHFIDGQRLTADRERDWAAVYVSFPGVGRVDAGGPVDRHAAQHPYPLLGEARADHLTGERLHATEQRPARDDGQLFDTEAAQPVGGFARDHAAADNRYPAGHLA